jgi:hypothetical protein
MIGRSGGVIPALLVLASPSAASSQQMAILEGFVRDEVRGIARAEVSAFDSLTNERRSATTDARGFFRMLDLSPGRYAVSVRALGYAPIARMLQLATGQRADLDLLLQPGPLVLEPLDVRALPLTAAEIERMSVATAVTEREMRNLPLSTRHVMGLAGVTPGIRTFRTATGNSVPAAGALRDERALNLYLDGVEMKNLNTGNLVGAPATGSPLPMDALQEFRVLLNTYDAEYTRGAAYVISATTHRGTNQRQGSAFASFQNKDLAAVNGFQRAIPNFEKPDFSRVQAGISLRGPFVQNRLFYAATYEQSATENYIAVVPGRPAADPGIWDQYAGVFRAPGRNHTGLLRLTWSPDDRNLLDAIWSTRFLARESGFGGTDAHASAIAQDIDVNTVTLRHRWLPTSRIANELSLQLVRWSFEDRPVVPGPEFRYPTLRIGRASAAFGIDETHFRLVERLTYSAGSGPGSHLLKGGLEISRASQRQYQPMNRSGLFSFRTELAEPHEAQIGLGLLDPGSDRDATASFAGWIAGGYLNDEWQPTSRLRVNLGIRYDAEINTFNNGFTVPWASDPILTSRPELQGLLNRGDRRNDLDNFSPRVSFSWDILGRRRAFLRGGFGIMYDRVPGNAALNERRTATWRTYVFTNPGTVDPEELRARVLSGENGTAVPPSIMLLPNRIELPENRQWSVGFGMELTRGLSLNVDYIDQDVRHLFTVVNLNWLDLSQSPAQRVFSTAYGNLTAWGDDARARYRAVLTSLSFRPDTSLQLTLAHTLGSAKAEWDDENVPVPAAMADQFYVMQRTTGDERHRFVLSGIWTLPYGLGLSAIATVASPRPYRTTIGQDVNQNNLLEDDWIDGSRVALPPNTWSHWYRVVDLRLSKAIDLDRGLRLSLIAEGFNLFNTENYAGYFGVQRSATGALRPDFGSPSGVFGTRQIQLGSRLEF